MFLPFAINLLRLSSRGKLPQVCVSPHKPQHLLSVHVILDSDEKNPSIEFSDLNCRENRKSSENVLFPDSHFFFLTP